MKRSHAFAIGVALSLAAAVGSAQNVFGANPVATTPQAPSEFGTQDYTVTTIAAASFTADSGSNFQTNLCCLARAFTGGSGDFYATANIPAGAVIDYIGLESYSPCAGIAGVELWEVTHGFTSGIVSFSSSAHNSYATDYNSSAIGYLNSANVHKALVVQVQMSSDCVSYPAFTWVEVWWRRVVSPAPGVASFNDVPTSDPAFQFVEAIAASGITAGCGGGNFCPDSPLTRRQMAVFLSKALGLHWPY